MSPHMASEAKSERHKQDKKAVMPGPRTRQRLCRGIASVPRAYNRNIKQRNLPQSNPGRAKSVSGFESPIELVEQTPE